MKPRERYETAQRDPLRPRLDEFIDMGEKLVKLARRIYWPHLGQAFGPRQSGKTTLALDIARSASIA